MSDKPDLVQRLRRELEQFDRDRARHKAAYMIKHMPATKIACMIAECRLNGMEGVSMIMDEIIKQTERHKR